MDTEDQRTRSNNHFDQLFRRNIIVEAVVCACGKMMHFSIIGVREFAT